MFAVANLTQRSCHIMKEVDIMEMQYRLNQERLLAEHKLNQEILVHCIARLNKKINMLYGRIKKIQIEMQSYKGSSYESYLQNKSDAYIAEQNRIKNKRQPILHLLMKAYRLSLDDVKQLLRQANNENFPTYKTIDDIVDMIKCCDFSFE